MPADDRFVTRAFRAGDETKILDLFARSFHQPRTIEHFRWKYERNPFGNAHISVTFDESGALVGHYSGYPVPFWYDGETVIAHQIGDTMTERSIRHIGRGPTSILGRTALDFYENFCAGKIAFNYGFNVSNIQRFSLKFLRSDRVEPIAYRIAPTPRRITKWERRLRGYRLELIEAASPELDAFFARVAPAYHFLVRRDSAYVRWRYFEHPDIKYFMVGIRKWRRLVAWIVFRLCDDVFRIVDALVDPEHDAALEVMLRHMVPQYPVTRMEMWCPSRPSWLDAVLRRCRFESAPEPQDLSVMCVPFVMSDATERMRAKLYYAMGDSDLA